MPLAKLLMSPLMCLTLSYLGVFADTIPVCDNALLSLLPTVFLLAQLTPFHTLSNGIIVLIHKEIFLEPTSFPKLGQVLLGKFLLLLYK